MHDVGVLEEGDFEGRAYVAMELVHGKSLRDVIGGDATMQQRIAWLVEIARALGAAHAAGLVHRDVKPDNVMVADDGHIKVLDFGIARAPLPSADTTTTNADIADALKTGNAGTPAYMAPERMMGSPANARADQFGFGVLAYELLTGNLPWGKGLDMVQVVAAVLHREVVVPKSVPAHVTSALRRALARDPDHRFPSMDALADALERAPRSLWPWIVSGAVAGSIAIAFFVAPHTPAPATAPPPASTQASAPTIVTTITPSPRPSTVASDAPATTPKKAAVVSAPRASAIAPAASSVPVLSTEPPVIDASPAPAPADSVSDLKQLYRRH